MLTCACAIHNCVNKVKHARMKLRLLGTFIEHNRYIFGAVQHSIIGRFWSIIGSGLLMAYGCVVTIHSFMGGFPFICICY